MDQFRRFFNTCRIPQKDKDTTISYFKTGSLETSFKYKQIKFNQKFFQSKASEGDCPTHLVIVYKNRFFKLEPYDRNKELLKISELYQSLSWIVDEYRDKPPGIGIGALTTDHRDNWAQV